MPLYDMTNQVIGRLTVIKRDESKPKGHGKPVYWICKCSCGNIKSIRADHLREGKTKSCGCLNKELSSKRSFKDLTNLVFGELTAIEPIGTNNQGNYIWRCKCSCGSETFASEGNLVSGHIKSCGCIKSMGEKRIGNILLENKIPFQTQYSFNDLLYKDKLKFDFAIFNNNELLCLIEYNGIQHYDTSNSWYSEENKKRDNLKKEYCKQHNILLIEIPYWDYEKINFEYLKEKCNL